MTVALLDVPLSAVVDTSVVSSKLGAPVRFTVANSTVPALSIARSIKRDATPFVVPRVAPDATVIDAAAPIVRVFTVPSFSVVLLNVSEVGFSVSVKAFVATDAAIGRSGAADMA